MDRSEDHNLDVRSIESDLDGRSLANCCCQLVVEIPRDAYDMSKPRFICRNRRASSTSRREAAELL